MPVTEITMKSVDEHEMPSGSPEYVRPNVAAARRGSLADMLALMDVAAGAKAKTDALASTTNQLCEKTDKQRRKSREQAQDVFGMLEADVAALKRYFRAIDVDDSGSIDVSELKKALERAGKRPTDAQVQVMIDKFDDNKDGVMQFNEYVAMVRDWDKILLAMDEETEREQAAVDAAKPRA